MAGSNLNAAAQSLYANSRDAMARTVRVQMAGLTPNMFKSLEDITTKYPSISTDLAMAMVKQGLNADTPGIDKVVTIDGISQLKRDQFNVDKIKSSVDKDKGILGSIGDAYRKYIYDPLKGATRITFAALRYPYDLATTLTRDLSVTPQPGQTVSGAYQSNAQQFFKDLRTLGGQNTQLGALIADRVGGKPGVDTGTGFFINPNSRVGKANARAMSSYGTINGDSFTIGRGLFRVLADNPDKTAYKVASGIVDAVLNIAMDPSTWFGPGGASKILKGAKELTEVKAITKPFAPGFVEETAKGVQKRLSRGIARKEREIQDLEVRNILQTEKVTTKLLQAEEVVFNNATLDDATKATLNPITYAEWLTTNPKVQNGDMLKGLDALLADSKSLSGFSEAAILLDEIPEAGKLSLGAHLDDEYFITALPGKKFKLLDLTDDMSGKTAKQVQAETNNRNMFIEFINDYATDAKLSPEVRGVFAALAKEINDDAAKLTGFAWPVAQIPLEGVPVKNLGYVLAQVMKSGNKEAIDLISEAVSKIWKVDGLSNVRSILGGTGGILLTNTSKIAGSYAQIGNALAELATPTNLGPNVAKLIQGLRPAEEKLAKSRTKLETLRKQREILERQIKDLDVYRDYAANQPELLAKLINEDSNFSGIDKIVKLKPDMDQKDLLAEAIRDKVGLVDFPGGSVADVPDFKKVLKFMLGRQFQEVADVVAKEKNYNKVRSLFGNRLDDEMVKLLTLAENSDDVMRVFLSHMGAVETDPRIFKSLALRAEAAKLSGNPLARLVQPVSLAPIRSLEALDRVYSRYFVRSVALNLNDLTALTNGIEDWISSAQFKTVLGKEGQQKLIDDVINKLFRAETEQARAKVIADSLSDTMRQVAQKYGLDNNDTEKLLELVKPGGKISTAETRYTVGHTIDGNNPTIVFAGDETIELPSGISYFQLMKSTVFLPDTKDILAAFNKYSLGKAMHGAKQFQVLLNDLGDTWRTAQLAFRAAYVIRNIAEMQMRQLLSGHTNMISNPLQFTAMVMANSGKTNAFTKYMAKYQYDLAGNLFRDEQAEGLYLQAVRAYQINAFRKESISDYRGNRSSEMYKFFSVLEASPQMSKETKKRFYQGLAYTLNRFAADPINSKVARLMAVGDDDAKRAFVQNIINDFDNPKSLVREYIDGIFTENEGIRRIFLKDINLEASKDNISFDKLYTFLFDEAQSNTIAGQIRAIQGLGPKGKEIFDIIADEGPIRAPWNVKVSTTREFDALERRFSKLLEERFSLEDIQGSRVLSERVGLGKSDNKKMIDNGVDWFFQSVATRYESKFNFGPEYQMAYWDYVGRYASMLSTADLNKALVSAQRALAPLRVGGKKVVDKISGKETIVGGVQIGRRHRTILAIQKELKLRAKGSAKANKGTATWVNIHQMAADNASKYVKNLFYDASRQKQWAQAWRIVAPFAQAHTNTLAKWGELGIRNPIPAYKFFKAFDALTKQGSNTIYDVTGMTYDDQQGFFYTEEGRTDKQFKMPLVGSVIGAMVGKNLSMGNSLQITAPVQSLNLAFGQVNPLVPGFGPAVQLAFIGSGKADTFGSAYDVMRDIITPFGKADSAEDIIFPSWFRKTILFWLGNNAEVQRRTKDWASYLASTGEYGDNPLADDAARTQLFSDAQKLSRSLGFMMGLFQSISPATPAAEVLAKIKNPENKMKFMTMSMLGNHFAELTRANPGNYMAAVKQFADTYGKNNLLLVLGGTTNAVRGTDDAWTFLNNNPEAAAKYARNPGDIVPFFFPGGEFSVKYNNWQKSTGARRALTASEMASEAEGMVYAMLKSQLVEEQIANNYPQFWLVDQIAKLDKQFGARPPDMIISGTAQERIARVGEALQDDALKDSPVYNETLEFYNMYTEFQNVLNELKISNYAELTSKGGYPTLLRNQLVSKAEELMIQNPLFSRMYYGVFYGQLEG